jgi:uncharacterized membrane protein
MSAAGENLGQGVEPADEAPRAPIIINDLSKDVVSEVLSLGWRDFKAAPAYGLFFGLIYAVGGWFIIALFYATQLNYVVYPLITGFALIAPFVAAGTYEVSRRLEKGEPLSWPNVLGSIVGPRGRELGWMALVTTFALIIWFDFAVFIYLMFFGLKVPTLSDLPQIIFNTPQGAVFLVIGNLTGAAIAFFVFSITVTSCPMLMDRDVDFVTAMITSVKTVYRNPKQMIAWAAMIGFMLAVSGATFFVALPVILPLLGHASWHMYRKAIS